MPKKKRQNIESILRAAGVLADIDIHFARFIERFSADRDFNVFLAAALASRACGNGDICLDLAAVAATPLPGLPAAIGDLVCPDLAPWRQALNASPAVGRPGDKCPLILDVRDRLYLYRYWNYEKKLADAIRQRSEGEMPDFSTHDATHVLRRLFPPDNRLVNWQQIAAAVAILKRFCIITGGPGSGKTFTIARILALLVECALGDKARIYLAAPTGKAAARLAESIMEAKEALVCSDRVKKAIPDEVHTIHRLLKPIRGTPYFHYNSENLLPADIVVVDEASMVDLALMSKLAEAIAFDARLLLIGDKDQLASVEAGSVLGDICDRQVIHGFTKSFLNTIERLTQTDLSDTVPVADAPSGPQDCITVLQESYRFTPHSGIGGLSRSVKRGDGEAALARVKNPADQTVDWHDIRSMAGLVNDLSRLIVKGYRKYLTTTDPMLAMLEFNRFKILCALKNGPLGVNRMNALAEKVLYREGLLPTLQPGAHPWYPGRPVLITRNDYDLGLYNGDMGIALPDPDSTDNELYVYFSDASEKFRRFPTHRLSAHETVYAMTVHKSQGSEFDHIMLLLPQRDHPLLTRELIYTGLTRARKMVSIWGTESVLKPAIERKIERTSGLRDALWRNE